MIPDSLALRIRSRKERATEGYYNATIKPAVNGQDLHTTIDLDLQWISVHWNESTYVDQLLVCISSRI